MRESARARAARLILEHLRTLPADAEVVIRPEGNRRRESVFQWPAPAGLFADADPPSPCGAGAAELSVYTTDEEEEEEPLRKVRFSARCCKAIREVIGEVGRRLTGSEVKAALNERQIDWSDSTVDHTLGEARRRGELSHKSDTRGQGYGLAEWA